MLPESKKKNYKPGHFSFNVKNSGRCENCEGNGYIKIKMNFLSDIQVKCNVCNGKRYKNEILSIFYKNKNISDILDMDISEALSFFKIILKLKKLFMY